MLKFQVIRNDFKNFNFFVFGSLLKNNQNFKKASNKVPLKADCPTFEVSYVNIGAFLPLEIVIIEKKTPYCKINTSFVAPRIQKNDPTCSFRYLIFMILTILSEKKSVVTVLRRFFFK